MHKASITCKPLKPGLRIVASRARATTQVGVMIRGTLGDIDPLNKVPFKRATSRVQKGPL